MPRVSPQHFSPRYYPNAGRRAAAEKRKLEPLEPTWEEKHERVEQRQKDEWRLEMMAKIEPERYLGMVEQDLCTPLFTTLARETLAKGRRT